MDPALQEFYSLSRSTSPQQPLPSSSQTPPRSLSRQDNDHRTNVSLYSWSSANHPMSVPSIAQLTLQPGFGDDHAQLAPVQGAHRRHSTFSANDNRDDASLAHCSNSISHDPAPNNPEWAQDLCETQRPRSIASRRGSHQHDNSAHSPIFSGAYGSSEHPGTIPANLNPHEYWAYVAGNRGNNPEDRIDGASEHDSLAEHNPAMESLSAHGYDDEDEDESRKQKHDGQGAAAKPTPLPKIPLLVLSIVIFSEPLTSTILFPFVYFMVRDFHITENEDEIGFFCGLIASSFFFAQFCTSVFWGFMSDRYGRRPILLLGLIGSNIACIFFGLSKSLLWAIVSRSMCGFLNGNIGVAKSMLGEIADPSNQSRAFSIFGFAWGIGMIIGPVLGGYLANPAKNFPEIFGNWPFFIEYPYFLPCLAASIWGIIGFTIGFFFLEETNQKPRPINEKQDLCIASEDLLAPTSSLYAHQDPQNAPDHENLRVPKRDNSSFSTANTISSRHEVDLERQPLLLSSSERIPQQHPQTLTLTPNNAANQSMQYGSMATLTSGPVDMSQTNNLNTHANNIPSACSTLSHRSIPVRHTVDPQNFHSNGPFGMSYPNYSVNTRDRSSFYTQSRRFSSDALAASHHPSTGYGRSGTESLVPEASSAYGYGHSYVFEGPVGGSTEQDARFDSRSIGRRSVAPSQIYILPMNPNNKDPGQPVQVVVVQSQQGLSPLSIATIISYSTLALHSIICEEVYTLYAVTPLKSGGLGWNAIQLSTSLATMGIFQLLLQFVVYPRLERIFSAVILFRVAQVIYVCVYMSFPMIRKFLVDEDDVETGGQTDLVRYSVLFVLIFKYVCSVFSYTSVMVMITNSAPAHLLGTVNGIGQMAASFMRAFGPALGGIVWAWSLSNKLQFPFNYFFVFLLMSSVAILCFIHSLTLPVELSRKKLN